MTADKKASGTWKPWLTQLAVSLAMALIFSALPLVFALVLNKSSLALAVLTAWYALIPAVIIFIAALLFNLKTRPWPRALGMIWINVAVWFILQYLLSALAGLNMVIRLLSLPAVLAGNTTNFLIAGLILLAAGIALYLAGRRTADPIPKPNVAWATLAALLALVVILLPAAITAFVNPRIRSVPEAAVPSRSEIFGWISDVYNLGERLPGSEADHRAISYLEDKLRSFGIQDVRVEKSNFDYWAPDKWALTVQPSSGNGWEANAFYVPYSGPAPAGGANAEVAYLGNISSPQWQDVKGKIVLVDIPATSVAWDQMKIFSYMAYEPENELKGWAHPYPVGWMLKYIPFYRQVEGRGPAGIIGILRDYPDMGKFTYYAPYDGELRHIPSLYLLPQEGDRLKAEVAAGRTSARLVLDARVAPQGGESANVYAMLPGRSNSIIMLHSHHDAPWRSGVEDSSGVGMVLALARYYAGLPQADRPFTLVFLFTGGHMAGTPTSRDFIERHGADILSRTQFDIAIEHVADDYMPGYPEPRKAEPRGVFITENPVTIGLFASSVGSVNLSRTLLFPTGSPLGVPTDAHPYHSAGVPIVSLISGPAWLFDDDDTLDRVYQADLVPLARLYVDFISRLGATPEWMLKFNLTWLTLLLLVLVTSPLAALFLAYRKRK